MASNLITTKLMPPVLPRQVVERLQLTKQLNAGLATKLILVSAPAGSGKSTLLASWLSELDRPAAWLSLEASDNDLERFLLYLVSALQQVEPGLGAGLPELLQTQHPVQPEPVLIRIVNDVARFNQKLLLVLDDYHLITDEKIHEAVAFFLDHLPLGLCLVIASRTDPPLALARLRVGRQLMEVRADQLRFSLEEAAVFLNERLHLELSQQAVAGLEERTEGWIAGLQLAALSLAGRSDKERFVQRFAGSHRFLVDYLMDEVLGRQTPAVRLFLQRTSILERFTASLCQAVTGQADSADVLKHLVNANLFLIALDDEGRWYRYHHLFAEFLRHRLVETEAESVPELHQRASAWLEGQGWLDDAIHHALLGDDLERAGRLVEEITFNLGIYWNSARIMKLMAKLPLELIATFPRLSLYYVWPLLNTGQVAALAAFLPILERSVSSSQQPRTMRALGFVLMGYGRMWLLDFSGAVALGHQALAVLEEAGAEPASDEERFMRASATNLIAYCHLHSDVAEADRFYPTALERSRQFGNLGSVSFTLARHGRVKHRLGQLRSAWKLFQTGLEVGQSGQREGERREVNVAELYVSAARLLYEWNRLDEAQSGLERAEPYSERSQYAPVQALGYQTAFELCLARGEPEAARAPLSRLDRLVREVDPHNAFFRQRFEAPAMYLRLRLAEAAPGRKQLRDEVAAWVEANGLKSDDAFSYPFEASYGVLARLFLTQGRADEALALLERLARAARAEGRGDDLIRYLILQTLAKDALGLPSSALERALALAEPQGYCRSFVDEGPIMRHLLERADPRRQRPYIQSLLRAFPADKVGATESAATQAASVSDMAWLEPLSEREVTVLRLLSAGQSNKAIAKELNLSPNTVKWYLRGIYDKFGVKGRLQAVNRAKDLGLL